MEAMNIFQIAIPTLLFLLAILVISNSMSLRGKLPYPPGPKGLPIIGNMLLMSQLTHRGLTKLAKEHGNNTGILHLKMGRLHVISVSSPDIAQQVLQAQDNEFADKPAAIAITYLTYNRADMVFAPYGPFWRQMRKLCVTKLFSRKRVESWVSVRDEVDAMVKTAAFSQGKALNVGELVFSLTMNIIYRAAFGSKNLGGGQQEEFGRILQEFSKLFGAFNVADFIPWLQWFDPQGFHSRLVNARSSLDAFIDLIIDQHIHKKNNNHENVINSITDMIDDLLAFYGQGEANKVTGQFGDLQSIKLTRDNIKAIIMDVMFGGAETAGLVIEWALVELMKRPEEMKKVQEELAVVVGFDRRVEEADLDKLTYLKCVVKETLRLHPPIPLLLHENAKDTEVAGFFIPAKSHVVINAWSIGRDKNYWEDTDTFKPCRFLKAGGLDFKGNNFEFIPFGSGRRSCPGMQFGLYALDLALANFLHCFTWKLPDGMKPSELDMSEVFGLTAPRSTRLIAIPSPRLSCPLEE